MYTTPGISSGKFGTILSMTRSTASGRHAVEGKCDDATPTGAVGIPEKVFRRLAIHARNYFDHRPNIGQSDVVRYFHRIARPYPSLLRVVTEGLGWTTRRPYRASFAPRLSAHNQGHATPLRLNHRIVTRGRPITLHAHPYVDMPTLVMPIVVRLSRSCQVRKTINFWGFAERGDRPASWPGTTTCAKGAACSMDRSGVQPLQGF